ncbi:MAG: 4-hydroxy-3-methylbut-2-enyl diphosphate reductase [Patescibacteria group bacterium]|jgi:4-hydroxy-3-methylbut-2-enyl diphosphate reductase
MEIILAKPRGFCAGVDRAVDTVELALRVFGRPIYVKHEIVHNTHVVEKLKNQGAIFVEDIMVIPQNARVIFSAHGVSPQVWTDAKAKSLKIIDATCPLVNRVHFEVKNFAKNGYEILLIGHRGHIEVEGTLGEAPDKVILVTDLEEAKNVKVMNPEKVAVVSQTTLSLDDTSNIMKILKKRFPKLATPPKSDICYATTNRQSAVKQLAKLVELIIVVGSIQSSNANRLREVSEAYGAKAYLVDSSEEINEKWFNGITNIGITSGASTPENIFNQIVKFIQSITGADVKELDNISEEVWFALPEEIVKEAKSNPQGQELLQKHNISKDVKMSIN